MKNIINNFIGFLIFGTFVIGLSSNVFAFDFPAGQKKNSFIDVTVNNIAVEGDRLVSDIVFDLSNVKLKGNSELVVTPAFIDNEGNELDFDSFTIAGRNRYYWLERNNKEPEVLFKGWGKNLQDMQYAIEGSLPYQPWLNDATLVLKTQDLGCANCQKGENEYPLAQTEFVDESYEAAEFIYVTPVAEAVKMREISARAYIDFVVNRTEINPTYRRNPEELAKIRATIDTVRNDKDIKITSLHISGTASPEGSYQNNVRLAKGRTESLKDYVQSLYKFPYGFITTSYEPVDWTGLAQFLKSKDFTEAELPHAQQILDIVNGDLEPYQRNSKIKSTYPKEYAWLLANVYPALRHSDYKIEFEIKTYTEVSEILDVMATQPNKLSLAELFVAANSQPEGSDLYNRAFELAVTMYPEDETANLNAGIAAMKRNDFVSAQRFLNNAGNTPEADYAKAVLAFIQEDYDTAKLLLNSLTNSSNQQVATQALRMLNNMNRVDAANGFHWQLLQ